MRCHMEQLPLMSLPPFCTPGGRQCMGARAALLQAALCLHFFPSDPFHWWPATTAVVVAAVRSYLSPLCGDPATHCSFLPTLSVPLEGGIRFGGHTVWRSAICRSFPRIVGCHSRVIVECTMEFTLPSFFASVDFLLMPLAPCPTRAITALHPSWLF